MRYLITGGAGFIGSHLSERLLRDGHSVVVMDDLCTGSIHNIEHLKNTRGFTYVIDTIFNRPLLAELVDDCDAIFHLAAAVGVKLIVESPVRTIDTNVKGSEIVLECAGKKKKKFCSPALRRCTASRKNTVLRRRRSGNGGTQKGRWSYACSKRSTNFLALAYGKERSCRGDCPALQHRWAAPDRALGRYCRTSCASARRRAHHGFRRRQPIAVALPRCKTRWSVGGLIQHPAAVGEFSTRQPGRDCHRDLARWVSDHAQFLGIIKIPSTRLRRRL